jgi:hypothetical protein
MNNKQFDNIGALWAQLTKNGVPYLSGEVVIDGAVLKIVIFQNISKRPGSRQPDYTIHADIERVRAVEAVIHADGAAVEQPF